jgi:hypothetical protein
MFIWSATEMHRFNHPVRHFLKEPVWLDSLPTNISLAKSKISFPDEVEFFNLPNPSSRTMALGSTQPLTEMSTRNLPGV